MIYGCTDSSGLVQNFAEQPLASGSQSISSVNGNNYINGHKELSFSDITDSGQHSRTVVKGKGITYLQCDMKSSDSKGYRSEALLPTAQQNQRPDLADEPQAGEKKLQNPEGTPSVIGNKQPPQPTTPRQPMATIYNDNNWSDYYKKELSIIKLINKSEEHGFTIDDESLLNMCTSMRFSGTDTLEKANSMRLKIIPPGPVFHTWFALKNTTIFDGNNHRLDYVSRISKSADILRAWGIPVFIVYTQNNMTEKQINEMSSLFSSHDNIVMLSIEEDLKHLSTASYYQRPPEFIGVDDIRFSVIMDFKTVLNALTKKANKENKTAFEEKLKRLGGKSIIYSDIDNIILRKPSFFLACSSFVEGPVLWDRKEFKNASYLPWCYSKKVKTASIDDLDDIKDKTKVLFNELISHSFASEDRIWVFLPGYYMVGDNFIRLSVDDDNYHLKSKKKNASIFNMYWKSILAYNSEKLDYEIATHRLHGLQLHNYLYVGNDRTWVPNKN